MTRDFTELTELGASMDIRPMTLADLEMALDWAAAEGWNPGLQDAIAFYQADPSGFWMGWLGDEPIASISAVRYGDRFGFIGFYIVQPAWRGKGYGWQLWQWAIKSLGDRTIGLDGVLAQVENYRRAGFQTAYHHIRHAGVGQTAAIDPSLVPLANLPFQQVLAYDTAHFPAPRPAFLHAWCHYPGYGMLQDGQIQGYGVIRPTRQGYKLGPLFADTPGIADALMQALSAQAAGSPIFLDIPDANPEAIALVQRYHMTPVFECARMYTQTLPSLPLSHIYGVTTLELG